MSIPSGAAARVLEQLHTMELCAPCLVAGAGATEAEVDGVVHRLTAVRTLNATNAVCPRCRHVTEVYYLRLLGRS
jgi:hypothetical protein